MKVRNFRENPSLISDTLLNFDTGNWKRELHANWYAIGVAGTKLGQGAYYPQCCRIAATATTAYNASVGNLADFGHDGFQVNTAASSFFSFQFS